MVGSSLFFKASESGHGAGDGVVPSRMWWLDSVEGVRWAVEGAVGGVRGAAADGRHALGIVAVGEGCVVGTAVGT